MANDSHFDDGLGIRINLVTQSLVFYEKSVKPNGLDGGDPINITTNDNTAQHSRAPRTLKTPTQITASVTYDESDAASYEAAINVSDTVRIDWPDDTTRANTGWLASFEPDEAQEGEQPVASVTFELEGEAPA